MVCCRAAHGTPIISNENVYRAPDFGQECPFSHFDRPGGCRFICGLSREREGAALFPIPPRPVCAGVDLISNVTDCNLLVALTDQPISTPTGMPPDQPIKLTSTRSSLAYVSAVHCRSAYSLLTGPS